MNVDDEARLQRIDDCRELYLKYGGRRHELIEKEMRSLGHRDFHRRSLYDRFERGRHKIGWVSRYGFDHLVRHERKRDAHLADVAAMRKRMGLDVEERFGSESPVSAGGEKSSPRDARGVAVLAPLLSEEGWHRFRDGVVGESDGVVLSSVDGHSEGHSSCGDQRTTPSAKRRHPSFVRRGVEAESEMPDFEEFKQWLKRVSPKMEWEWRHQVYIYRRLKRVFDGLCKRLMLFLPPRHGKSELVTVRYAAYCLKQDPKLNIILGSYNQRLANRFSRKIRRVLSDDAELRRGEGEKGRKGERTKPQAETALSGPKPQTRCEFPSRCQAHAAVSSSPSLPFSFSSARRVNSEAEWETSQGGGLRAVGVGGGVTGFGAGLIIIDDPVKSRAEAESQTYRDNIWDWFNDDLYTRLEPDGAIVLIQTRWHEDDLAGRLLREANEEGGEQWEVVNLPALAETSQVRNAECGVRNENDYVEMSLKGTKIIAQGKAEGRHPGYDAQYDADPEGVEQTAGDVTPLQGADVVETIPGVTLAHPRLLSLSPSATGDPLGRLPGQALCPERYDETALERLRRKLGSYSFAALYQQRPVPAEGGLFKRNWFKNIIPVAPEGLRWNRGYDLAMSNTATSDYTASLRTAYDREGNLYIDGGFRKRMEYPEQRKYILGRIQAERDTLQHCVELSANGNAVIQDLRRDTRILGRTLRGVKVEGSKVSRALPWIALAEAGKVFLIRAAWNAEFINEACSFPAGTHDDQIDAVSIAVKMSRPTSGRFMTF